jgi:DNA-binding IclR family transcriptional regulator
MKEAKTRYEVAVVGRALDILTELAHGDSHTTASAARFTGTSHATAYRLLVTLESRGYVVHDRSTGSWLPGPALFAIAETSTRERLRAIALPHLTTLRDAEMETVNLAELVNGDLVYIEVLESPLRFRMSGERGERAPLHATALGRAWLAAQPSRQRAALLEALPLEPLTTRTIVDRDRLEAELEATAARGWGEEQGETEIGVTCFGAAVLGPNGRPVGAVSISAPDARLDPARRRRLGRAIRDTAAVISEALDADAD